MKRKSSNELRIAEEVFWTMYSVYAHVKTREHRLAGKGADDFALDLRQGAELGGAYLLGERDK